MRPNRRSTKLLIKVAIRFHEELQQQCLEFISQMLRNEFLKFRLICQFRLQTNRNYAMNQEKNYCSSANQYFQTFEFCQSRAELRFLKENEPSFKELHVLSMTKDRDDANDPSCREEQRQQLEGKEEEVFELEMQLQLKKFTSFEKEFMESHKAVLRNSLIKFGHGGTEKVSDPVPSTPIDLPAFLFDPKIFSEKDIHTNELMLKQNVEDYEILREAVSCLGSEPRSYIQDAVLLSCYIFKKIGPIFERLKRFRSFEVSEVEKFLGDLIDYLQRESNITVLRVSESDCEENGSQREALVATVETWVYTILIAKLGYFQNDSFNNNLTLCSHLSDLTSDWKRSDSLLFDLSDEQFSETPRKVRKL